ncbi:MAG: cation:proton antiporter [Armatimonadetes bacterium]|nr:cation:proton antiporter [Armatimonadota bacterium]
MTLLAAATQEVSLVFIELGVAVLVLAFLSRVASKFGFSAIPLYLLTGLAFGNGGLVPLRFGEGFVRVGSEVGVVLLMFMLGLEYTGEKLVSTLKEGYRAGVKDLLLNFLPGVAAGFALHMSWPACLLLGGVTYISSSGVVAKILSETAASVNCSRLVVSLLVLEDLAMAAYLPLMAVLATGASLAVGALAVAVALATVFVAIFAAVRFGPRLSGFVSHQSDEVLLFSVLGLVLLVSGVAQQLQVSAAVGAFLIGVAISGSIVHRTERLLSPLRDLFAAIFFLFFGLQIDPSSLVPVLPVACGLAAAAAVTKILTGMWCARRAGLTTREGVQAGAILVPRGEFSVVIAGLGLNLDPRLGSLSAAFVLLLAVLGPVLARALRS